MKIRLPEGNAIVYCEGAFNTTNGKTAHGLVRFTERYRIAAVVDSKYRGCDAGEILDGKSNGIPVVGDLPTALKSAEDRNLDATHLVIGLAPDGGRLDFSVRKDLELAIESGLNIDSGLHDFLSEDDRFRDMARRAGVKIRDIRKTPPRSDLHFFTGKIEQVNTLKLAVLGTDSAIGKRTTAWMIVHGLRQSGKKAEMIGTGQTAWMQGARYAIIMDSLINDFVSGEIEHAVYEAWKNENPDVIIIEGQGSLLNPAYPGGFEILAAGRPDHIILQHAPRRFEYDGFPGYQLHPLDQQIKALEIISGKKVTAITINHERMSPEEVRQSYMDIEAAHGIPAFDVLLDGPGGLIKHINSLF
jgi:uncharacterized NAD-dependent epimerase/dehydratase family protein